MSTENREEADHGIEITKENKPGSPLDIATLGEGIGQKFEEIQQKVDAAKKAADTKSNEELVKIDGVPDMTIEQLAKVVQHVRGLGDSNTRIRDAARLMEIKQSTDLRSQTTAFLMDMAGVQPYRRTLQAGMVTVTFQLLSSEDITTVNQQCVRDVQQGRVASSDESMFFLYKMAMSIEEIKLRIPNQTVKDDYMKLSDLSGFDRNKLKLTKLDLLPRALYVTLVNSILKSSVFSKIVSQQFLKFENDVESLIFLAAKEPDFFLEPSTEGP